MAELRIVVVGAGGRMGRALIRAIHDIPGARLVAAIERADSGFLGQDAGMLAGLEPLKVPVTDDALVAFAAADAVLDFTTPEATLSFLEYAAQARIVHVIGTTGMSAEDDEKVFAASRHARIVKSGNMSLGVNLLSVLVEQGARALGLEWDIEVLEMHHRNKVDAPSGTALLLGNAAAKGRAVDLADHSVRVRDGVTGAREPGSIGFATLRGGSVVGSHSVIFAGDGERVELSHIAEDRSIFAQGAVKAALWAFPQKPDLYNMQDVLGLSHQ
uniref:4-hydroxy-tetrahydrodipicolinate reductase n=1 Tax=Pararhizobium sp. IMCC3301 TaxID=3067904 RepID=UPI0027419E08|nr:4-hydroxy-tetrahydrodipicolinate reductase [Pararhizobium sp. IMCC3301]